MRQRVSVTRFLSRAHTFPAVPPTILVVCTDCRQGANIPPRFPRGSPDQSPRVQQRERSEREERKEKREERRDKRQEREERRERREGRREERREKREKREEILEKRD